MLSCLLSSPSNAFPLEKKQLDKMRLSAAAPTSFSQETLAMESQLLRTPPRMFSFYFDFQSSENLLIYAQIPSGYGEHWYHQC